MTTVLEFDATSESIDARKIRVARFRPRTSVPMTAACHVANGMREAVAAKLAAQCEVHVLAPLVPSAEAMQTLLDESDVSRIDGVNGTAWLVVPRRALSKLVAAAFGEDAPSRPARSPIEDHTARRMLLELANLCAPLCGAIRGVVPTSDLAPVACCASFTAFSFGAPLDLTIGLALAKDPPQAFGPALGLAGIESVAVRLRAVAGSANLTLGELGALEIGALLPMSREEGAHLIAGDTVIARGTCGVSRGHAAFLVGDSGESSPT